MHIQALTTSPFEVLLCDGRFHVGFLIILSGFQTKDTAYWQRLHLSQAIFPRKVWPDEGTKRVLIIEMSLLEGIRIADRKQLNICGSWNWGQKPTG